MQERLGRGEFNPDTTRVLHFVRNPEAEQQRETAVARIEELELENTALRGQLQQLEVQQRQQQQPGQGTAAGAAEEHGVAAAVSEAEIAILKRKVCCSPQLAADTYFHCNIA